MATRVSAIDPVCGMDVDPATAMTVEYDGTRYFFCEVVCAETFREEPQRWVEPEAGRQLQGINASGKLDQRAWGNTTRKVAPRPGPSLSAHTVPPIRPTSALAIASPIPDPPSARERDGSTR